MVNACALMLFVSKRTAEPENTAPIWDSSNTSVKKKTTNVKKSTVPTTSTVKAETTADQHVAITHVSMLNVLIENTVVTSKSALDTPTVTNVSMFNVLPTLIAKPISVLLTDVLVTN